MGQPSWAEIEAALERLRRMLEPRVGKNATRTIVQNLWRLRETPGVAPLAILQDVRREPFASSLLGLERPVPTDQAEMLILCVDPPRVRLVYRPPVLHFERY